MARRWSQTLGAMYWLLSRNREMSANCTSSCWYTSQRLHNRVSLNFSGAWPVRSVHCNLGSCADAHQPNPILPKGVKGRRCKPLANVVQSVGENRQRPTSAGRSLATWSEQTRWRRLHHASPLTVGYRGCGSRETSTRSVLAPKQPLWRFLIQRLCVPIAAEFAMFRPRIEKWSQSPLRDEYSIPSNITETNLERLCGPVGNSSSFNASTSLLNTNGTRSDKWPRPDKR